MEPLRLVSLNVEFSRHLDTAPRFLSGERPHVACIQELYERDIERFRSALGGAECFFVPMTKHLVSEAPPVMGTAIFSSLPILQKGVEYYRGSAESVPEMSITDASTFNNKNCSVAWCDAGHERSVFRIATTHFTWTPDGLPSEEQRRDMRALLGILGQLDQFVLAGDFNAPRGGEMFGALSARYTDNIPPHYRGSLDPVLHRSKRLDLMVDGVFSASDYAVSDVELVTGVSDHCAIRASIRRKS